VNEGSASAAEIFSGAIKDNKRGIIIGTNTFGKAAVQTVMPMKDGSALRLTTAYYLTPSGKFIKEHGITPDIRIDKESVREKEAKEEEKEDLYSKLEDKKDQAKEESAAAKLKEDVVRDNYIDMAIATIKTQKICESLKTNGVK
jgi:carboxyl-terminal processing protease